MTKTLARITIEQAIELATVVAPDIIWTFKSLIPNGGGINLIGIGFYSFQIDATKRKCYLYCKSEEITLTSEQETLFKNHLKGIGISLNCKRSQIVKKWKKNEHLEKKIDYNSYIGKQIVKINGKKFHSDKHIETVIGIIPHPNFETWQAFVFEDGSYIRCICCVLAELE